MSKWSSELTEEKLKDQITSAKEKYKSFRVRVVEVSYDPENQQISLVVEDDRVANKTYLYLYDKTEFKCLERVSDEDLKEVSLLGSRAIQWEKLDIQIGLDKLLEGIQIMHNWLLDLHK